MLFRRQEPILRHYVSDTDHFLYAFELKSEASSVARREEEKKYREIGKARDTRIEIGPVKQLWEDF